ncbi:MAG: tripartite tricarboxylate transporter substrate binding protein [SAR324 cluster bacterium]|nr:tripartite tricarboxylate transporter substrate binding protein [SAR324 cluster bacterium]
MIIRKFIQSLFAIGVGLLMIVGSAFAEYPEKPITLVLPLGAGGSHDLNARVFTSIIPEYLGNAVIVKLMPGASGQTGTAAVANAKPDGYTLLFTHNYFDQLQQHVTKLPYDTTRDFKTVARINYGVASIVVRADKPWKTLDEMVDYGKQNPGKLVFGHSGQWGAIFVPAAQFLTESGVKAKFVPYKGGGPAMKALLAGDSDFTMAFTSVIKAQGSKLRVLASGGNSRVFPDIPTLKELGFKSDIGRMYRLVMAPRGVPEDRMKTLYAAFEKLNGNKTYKRMMGRLDENTDLMLGPEYEMQRPTQSDEFKVMVKAITGN